MISEMSKFELWSLIFQILTFAVGLSVLWQLWTGIRTMQDSVYTTANSWMLDLDKVLLENADLRAYFYDGKTIDPKDADYAKVMAMAEYMADTFDFFLKHRFGSRSKPIQSSWHNDILNRIEKSPALKRYLDDNKESYRPEDSALGALYLASFSPAISPSNKP